MSDELYRLLTLQDWNTRIALAGTGLLGAASGVIGSLAVLRRRALMGDALAHAALPGLWAAFFVMRERHFAGLLLGAALAGTLGVLIVVSLRRYTRIKEDAAIGIVLSVFFGAGMCLSRILQSAGIGNTAGLDSFIFGKAASMLGEDVQAIAIVAAVVIGCVVLFYKEFRLLCFDREFAGALGWPVLLLDVWLMALLVLCTVIGLPAVGVVLMAALLITPAAAARFWTDRLSWMIVLAAIFGALSGLIGSGLSALYTHLSTGPAVVLAAASFFTISMLFAPRRGIAADAFKRWQLRRKIGLQNLLRTMYELSERRPGGRPTYRLEEIEGGRAWTRQIAGLQLARAAREGLVYEALDGYGLTPAGRVAAERVVRVHRLWEMFLVEHASIAPDHVDRDADQIEHILPPELLRELEEKLQAEGRLPTVPKSPHVLGESAV